MTYSMTLLSALNMTGRQMSLSDARIVRTVIYTATDIILTASWETIYRTSTVSVLKQKELKGNFNAFNTLGALGNQVKMKSVIDYLFDPERFATEAERKTVATANEITNQLIRKEQNIMKIPDKLYNILKWVVVIVLPAIATAYWGLSQLWGFPYAEQIVGTISVIETFLGAIIGISTHAYYKGQNGVINDEK